MASPLYQAIEVMSRDKGIDPAVVVGAVEDAIALATRKYYKTATNMRGEFDKETGEIRAYEYKTVVEPNEEGVIEDPDNMLSLEEARALAGDVEVGAELRFYKDTSPLGRIAAQMAKQVIFQKVREAERDTVFNEYNHRVGEILNATVKRVEPMDVIVDLDKAEARMPKREQSRLEQFAVGERIRVALIRVDRAAKGPQVIVSRAAPALVQTLFQSEVPEIYDGTVMIRAIAREAGERTKIAVTSRDKDVDPVGACVGMKGMRVQSIIRELRGEKIDIIEYSDEITTFAEKALQPAKVSRVSIADLAEKQLEVIVDDTQLSLAIGKKGQNVRLAAKLLGWKIDIKSEEEKRQEVEQQMQALQGAPQTPIEQVKELDPAVMEKLIAAGITTVEQVADMTEEELGEVPGIGERSVEKIAIAVRDYFGQLDEAAAKASAEKATAVDSASKEEGAAVDSTLADSTDESPEQNAEGEETSVAKTPEQILAEQNEGSGNVPTEVTESADAILEREELLADLDGYSDADNREAGIEADNQTIEDLAAETGEISDETIDSDGHDRG